MNIDSCHVACHQLPDLKRKTPGDTFHVLLFFILSHFIWRSGTSNDVSPAVMNCMTSSPSRLALGEINVLSMQLKSSAPSHQWVSM